MEAVCLYLFDTACELMQWNPPPKYVLQIKLGYWVLITMTYFVGEYTH